MKKRRKKLLLVLAACATAWIASSAVQLLRFKHSIRNACAEADCLVVDFNVVPRGSQLHERLREMPAIRIGGPEKIQEFEKLLAFEMSWLPFYGHCQCFGEFAFRLDRGGEPLKMLTFHHGESLRWCSLEGPNFELTASSSAALTKWLEQNGGERLRQADEQAGQLWKQLADEQWHGSRRESAPATRVTTATAPE